ncbi:DEAD/DEAH box helicase [Myxococcus sp. SDU36]|uniref:DEAD/DEAH box helicase n=1 Tax=Myxococcus sp. SDU36 TaxID=2831967 RepID=UPI002542E290|nr:DEAD/DEAH box helicase [Myxococcus sp. SDU36]WIG94817.1 DEAD/DEAH box helicase [Myxococcus sp. SDU36]
MLEVASGNARSTLGRWLTDALLREEAGEDLYEQGKDLLARKRVLSVQACGDVVEGTVAVGRPRPYSVRISASGEGDVFSCECADFLALSFCKHLVAVGLAWLRQPDKAPVTERPATSAALQAWMEAHQVTHAGGDPLSVLGSHLPEALRRHGALERLSNTSIGTVLGSVVARGYLNAHHRALLEDAAWGHVCREAERVRQGLEREQDAAPRPPLTDVRLKPLMEALVQERERLRARVPPRVLETPPAILLRERPARLLVSETGALPAHPLLSDAHFQGVIVEPHALLDGGPGVRCRCTRDSGAGCVHALTALDAVLDSLGEKAAAPRNARLAELLYDVPGQYILERLEAASLATPVEDAPAPESQVSFRLEQGTSLAFTLRAYLHRPTKTGKLSKGTQVGWRDRPAALALLTAPGEREALALVEASASLASSGFSFNPSAEEGHWVLLLQALRALTHSARLHLAERPDVPLQVREAPLGFLFEEQDDGTLRVRPAVEGAAVQVGDLHPPTSAARTSQPWLLLEREVPRVTLLAVAPEAAELLTTLRETGARLPASARGDLLTRLSGLEARVPLTLPSSMEGAEVEPERGLWVRLRPVGEEALEGTVLARPLREGPLLVPGEGAPVVRGVRGRQRVRVSRNLAAERAEAAALLERLGLPHGAHRFTRGDVASSLALLEALAPLDDGEGVRVEWAQQQPWRVSSTPDASALRVRVGSGQDWFGVEGELKVDGERVALAVLLEAVRRRSRYVRLGPGRWMRLTDSLRERLAPLADLTFPTRKGLEVSAAAAPVLDGLEEAGARVQAPPDWRKLATRIREAQASKVAVPRKLKAGLRDYQREGFVWMARLASWGGGACLADDMGLGKTLQALALLLHRAAEGPALVVAPTSVCFNWAREAARFAPSLRIHSYRESEREALLEALGPGDVLVASYGLLVKDAKRFADVSFATLVVDEAQAVKNPDTARARALRTVNADARVALTGTPVENRLSELWSLYALLFPGLLGSRESFRSRFAVPIERDRDAGARDSLARVVRPFLLRRTKGEVARELPARIETVVSVALSAGERRLYDDVRLAALAQVGEAPGMDARFALLAALTRLRLAACHPRLVDEDSVLPSSKLERLLELVDTVRASGGRALVFSQFVKHLALAREALAARGVSMQYLDGQTPPAERQARVEAFQGGQGDLFLISLKAGGTGLNLTAADHVIHLDPWWNPAVEDQATDRAHRIGQTRPVTVSRLVSEGTLEEAILALHAEKRELADSLLSGADGGAALSPEQLLALLRFGAAGGA